MRTALRRLLVLSLVALPILAIPGPVAAATMATTCKTVSVANRATWYETGSGKVLADGYVGVKAYVCRLVDLGGYQVSSGPTATYTAIAGVKPAISASKGTVAEPGSLDATLRVTGTFDYRKSAFIVDQTASVSTSIYVRPDGSLYGRLTWSTTPGTAVRVS